MDLPEIATFAAALLAVLALIMAIAWVLRRFYGGAQRPGQSALRRRDRRLGVIEAAQVGPRHRLLLVRRDDREHLLLIGGATELVIETDIPHDRGEPEVNIRQVEPRLRDEQEDEDRYRRSDDYESRTPHRTLGSSGFGSAFADRPDEPEAEEDRDFSTPRFGFGERDDDRDDDDYDREDRPSYRFDDRSRNYERGSSSSVFDQDRESSDDRLVVDDTEGAGRDEGDRYAPAISGAGEAEEHEPADPTQSRILSRFLKKDGP